MNKILAEGGAKKKWTAEEYVKDRFNKAMKNTMLRPGDEAVKWVKSNAMSPKAKSRGSELYGTWNFLRDIRDILAIL